MATTQFTKVVGTTGASGAQGYTGLCAQHTTDVNTAIAGLTGITGYVGGSTTTYNTLAMMQDSNAGTLYMTTAINYITSA